MIISSSAATWYDDNVQLHFTRIRSVQRGNPYYFPLNTPARFEILPVHNRAEHCGKNRTFLPGLKQNKVFDWVFIARLLELGCKRFTHNGTWWPTNNLERGSPDALYVMIHTDHSGKHTNAHGLNLCRFIINTFVLANRHITVELACHDSRRMCSICSMSHEFQYSLHFNGRC